MSKRRFLSIVATFFLASAIFMSCSKYEDGPLLSLKTKKARLVNKWKIEKYYVNNVDYTSSLYDGTYMEFSDNGDFHFTLITEGSLTIEDTTVIDGTWEFSKKKDDVDVTMNYTYYDFWSDEYIQTTQIQNWEIIMLKNEAISFESITGGYVYKYDLVPLN